jgi:hypothetical protein
MCILTYPFLEATVFVIWLLMASGWKGVERRESEASERQLGYGAVKDAVQAGMNVSGIILAGLGVMLGWSQKGILFSPPIKFQLQLVGTFAIAAIVLGAVLFSLLPSRVRRENPAHDRSIATIGALQLILLASAAARFGATILMILQHGKP